MLEVKEHHDCESIRPSMVVGEREEYRRSGTWPFVRKVLVTVKLYDTQQHRWTCPECGSRWDYHALNETWPFWMCNYRPEKWSKV